MSTGGSASLKEALTAQLYQLFRVHGFEGVSIGAISAATGLSRSSLYHHFPGGKEEMAEAVVARARGWFAGHVTGPLRGAGTPQARLKAMLSAMDEAFAGGSEPCLVASMLVGAGSNPVTDGLRALLNEWFDALGACLVEMGTPKAKARPAAAAIIGRIEGALILSRGLGDRSHFKAALNDIAREAG